MSGVDIAKLQQWQGNTQVVVDELDPWRARALAATLDQDWAPAAGELLPLCWQWLYFNEIPKARDTGNDGHPLGGRFLPPSPLPRRMWAAGNIEVYRQLRLGERAERRSTVAKVDLKEGRSGALVFVTLEHRLSQGGQECMREEQYLVYRPMPMSQQELPPGEVARLTAQWRTGVQADPVLLFRFSALTSNSHRIHYDREYARSVEHYPALVVHGPLQACLLSSFLTRQLPQASVHSFKFRARRPIFDTEKFCLCGYHSGDDVELWTETQDGTIGMSVAVKLH